MTERAEDHGISDLPVGTVRDLRWTVRAEDVDAFAALSGDFNPLHIDDDYARSQGFPARVAHGFLLGAKVSALVGMLLPGRRCLLLDHSLSYPKPVHVSDDVTLTGTVAARHEEMSLIEVKLRATVIRDEIATTVARGKATCKILY
ncbi:MaoC family dehydratase [Rhodospirillaceae bacterium KN72]|uniref:MaoC family dehydratase n=1 Tax=Pacificispira spongiicola TaxID=2729598 RepID=A0A7Y0DWT8_9PROT|nr:MaoC family dehydratase [Pacificispira spongiicola]NMM43048.1 MaoC family dehydratase [Pacificispira spongiicola]